MIVTRKRTINLKDNHTPDTLFKEVEQKKTNTYTHTDFYRNEVDLRIFKKIYILITDRT